MNRRHCANDNHGRAVVTVRFCPTCGEIVNKNIAVERCSRESHGRRRMSQSAFCFACGERLFQGTS